jgi:hypothetical protein
MNIEKMIEAIKALIRDPDRDGSFAVEGVGPDGTPVMIEPTGTLIPKACLAIQNERGSTMYGPYWEAPWWVVATAYFTDTPLDVRVLERIG